MSLRIVVAEDHEIVRCGLRFILESEAGWTVCGEAGDGRMAVEQVAALAPDVAIMGLEMSNLNGIEATRRILARPSCGTAVLILATAAPECVVHEALTAGANGIVLKSETGRGLLNAVRGLSEGRRFISAPIAGASVWTRLGLAPGETAPTKVSRLTAREFQVLRLLAEGHGNKQVANALGISVKTAESHRANLMKKVHAGSVSDLVRYAIRHRMIEA